MLFLRLFYFFLFVTCVAAINTQNSCNFKTIKSLNEARGILEIINENSLVVFDESALCIKEDKILQPQYFYSDFRNDLQMKYWAGENQYWSKHIAWDETLLRKGKYKLIDLEAIEFIKTLQQKGAKVIAFINNCFTIGSIYPPEAPSKNDVFHSPKENFLSKFDIDLGINFNINDFNKVINKTNNLCIGYEFYRGLIYKNSDKICSILIDSIKNNCFNFKPDKIIYFSATNDFKDLSELESLNISLFRYHHIVYEMMQEAPLTEDEKKVADFQMQHYCYTTGWASDNEVLELLGDQAK